MKYDWLIDSCDFGDTCGNIDLKLLESWTYLRSTLLLGYNIKAVFFFTM